MVALGSQGPDRFGSHAVTLAGVPTRVPGSIINGGGTISNERDKTAGLRFALAPGHHAPDLVARARNVNQAARSFPALPSLHGHADLLEQLLALFLKQLGQVGQRLARGECLRDTGEPARKGI